jgi:hypothetical protein
MKIKVAIVSAVMFLGTAGSLAAETAIHVSCFRGPLKAVIWDRANPEFIESFVTYGYSRKTAMALADSICRDQNLVDPSDDMVAAVRALMAATPKDG